MNDIFVIDADFDLIKGRATHKYIKRTGSPGNYKYWYKLPDGRVVSSDDAESPLNHAQSKIEHLRRLVQAKNKGHHQMTREQMLAHVGMLREQLTGNKHIFQNAHRRGHQYDEHELRTAHLAEEQSKEAPSSSRPTAAAPATPARTRRPRTPRSTPAATTSALAATPAITGTLAPLSGILNQEELKELKEGLEIKTPGEAKNSKVGRIDDYRDEYKESVIAEIKENETKGLFTVGFKYLQVAEDSENYETALAKYGFRKVETPSGEDSPAITMINADGVVFIASRESGGYSNLTGPKAATRSLMKKILSEASYVKDVSPWVDGLMGQPKDDFLNKVKQNQSSPSSSSEEQDILRQLKEMGVDLAAQAETPSIRDASRERAQAAVDRIRREAAPGSQSHTALAEAQPNRDFAQADAPVARMAETQAAGSNPYLERAKEIFNRIKTDVKPERKQVVEHLLQAIERSGSELTEQNVLKAYKEISGRSVRGISGISEDFEKATFVSLDEIIKNEPIDIEVERFKRGYAMKQFARLKPFIKDSWHQANPSAPPPMPTFGDIKSWTEHGGLKPTWAGTTRLAMPKEVFDASMKKDGKPQYPPAWMPIHLMPAWNYIVKKAADGNPYQTQAARFTQDQRLSLGSQAQYQEGIAIAALRKYVQMRGDSNLVDIPKSKLTEMGLSHADIFKALGDDLAKVLTTKIIDPVTLVPFINAAMQEQKGSDKAKTKKSFVLVVDRDTPAHLGKKGEALQKSKLIEKLRMLRKSL